MKAVAKAPVRKISVILADDHPVVRDGLAAIVNQQADMQVVAEAGDGAEALELYETHKPDVMVLDLRMPKLDGAAVVQKVLEKHPKACLLIMTTYDGDEDIFRSLSQGAKGYLLKDAPRQEILSALARARRAAARRRGSIQQGHRATPRDHRRHRQDPREGHPRQARRHQPHRGGRRRAQARLDQAELKHFRSTELKHFRSTSGMLQVRGQTSRISGTATATTSSDNGAPSLA
jgi:DNA-binding NarL/FixJ family response regulator